MSQRTPRPDPAALALVVVLVFAGGYMSSCARTPLDQPVDVSGTAGTRAPAGSAGTGGAGGRAGSGGAGTTGKAGNTGVAGTGVGGTGFADCIDGTSRCASANGIQLCQGGKWGPISTCSMACISGVCAECMPGEKQCSGPASFRTCTSAGLWPDPVMCPSGSTCAGGSCTGPVVDGGVDGAFDGDLDGAGTCLEGMSECTDDKMSAHLCINGAWTAPFMCEHGCIGGVCAECTPGEVRCAGNQTCAMTGVWQGPDCAS